MLHPKVLTKNENPYSFARNTGFTNIPTIAFPICNNAFPQILLKLERDTDKVLDSSQGALKCNKYKTSHGMFVCSLQTTSEIKGAQHSRG